MLGLAETFLEAFEEGGEELTYLVKDFSPALFDIRGNMLRYLYTPDKQVLYYKQYSSCTFRLYIPPRRHSL